MARDSTKAAEWAEILRRFRRSGQSQLAFCEQHGLSHHALRWWHYQPRAKRLLQALDGAAPRSRLRTADPKLPEPRAHRFLPVRVIEAEPAREAEGPSRDASSPIQILLNGGRRIAVPPGFDAETLLRVVHLLESPGC